MPCGPAGTQTYFRSRELYRLIPGDKAWMYLSFNQDRRSFTVVGMKPAASDARTIAQRAQANGIPVTVLHLDSEELRETYGANLALIRPDQPVAWRGDSADVLAGAIPRAIGI